MENSKPDSAKNRLYKILVTQSAHLIQGLRCERRIDNEDNPSDHHTTKAVRRRWYNKINERMRIDCQATDQQMPIRTKGSENREGISHLGKMLHQHYRPPSRVVQATWFLVGTTSGHPPG